MFDLNTILSAAIKSAIDSATADLRQQIATLEERHRVSQEAHVQRIEALEERITATPSPAGQINLRSTDFVQAVEVITARLVEDAVSEAMSDHCNEYDHDDFLTEIDDSAVEDSVREAVRNLSFEVTVSR